jgi:hypothetical protein
MRVRGYNFKDELQFQFGDDLGNVWTLMCFPFGEEQKYFRIYEDTDISHTRSNVEIADVAVMYGWGSKDARYFFRDNKLLDLTDTMHKLCLPTRDLIGKWNGADASSEELGYFSLGLALRDIKQRKLNLYHLEQGVNFSEVINNVVTYNSIRARGDPIYGMIIFD